MKTLIQSKAVGIVVLLALAQMAQAQTLLLQLKAANYNPTTGFWTNSVGPNAQALSPYPTVTTGASPNGSKAIVFNGSNPMALSSPISDGGNGFTVFAYTKPAPGGGNYAWIGGSAGAFEWRVSDNKQDALRQSQLDLGSETSTMSTSAFSLIDATVSSSGGGFRLNEVADGTSSGTSFTASISEVGGRLNSATDGENFRGSICEIDVYSGVLNSAQISTVEAQLTASYITTGPTLLIGLAAVSPTNDVYAGTPVTLSAPVSGATGSTTFIWQTDNGSGGASFANISGATTTNYVLNTTSLANSGTTTYEYQLIGTPSGGNSVTSAPVTLTVEPASYPQLSTDISASPSIATVEGSETLSATFLGTLPIHYQWQVSQDQSTISNVIGATNTTLVLNNLQLSQNGLYYRLQATNTISPYVSDSSWVQLDVQPLTPLVQLIATNYDPVAGIWVDASPNGNNASYALGSNPTLVPFVTPNGGSAVNITSAGGHFELNSSLDPTSGYTVIAYVMPSIVSSGGSRFALTGGDASGALEYNFYQGKQNYLLEYIGGGGAGNTNVPTTNFCLVDLAVNSSGGAFRFNGASDGNVVGATFTAPLTRIGNNEGNGDGFTGEIAEIDVYNGVLSSNQISALEGQFITNYVIVNSVIIGGASASPTNVTFAGNPITLSAPELGGTATTTYHWQTDNGSGGASFSNIPGATSTNYVLNTSSLLGTYEYQLVGTPQGGIAVTGAPVTLTVQSPSSPQELVDTTPSSGTATVGGNFTFSAAFVGNLPIHYQWQVSPDESAISSVPGATNSTLVLTNIQLTQNGLYYRLQATNAVAPYVADSDWAQLSVQALAPVVQLIATNYDPSVGVWTDSSPNGNSATYSGGAIPTLVSAVTPNGGSAVNITAGGGHFELSSSLDPSLGYTVIAYVMPSIVASGNSRFALTGGDASGALEYNFYQGTQNYLLEYIGGGGAGNASISTNIFSLVDLAVNSSGGSFRINGASDGNVAGATFTSPLTRIGNNEGGGDGFVGNIAEIDIYSGVLSAGQLSSIEAQFLSVYGVPRATNPTNIVAKITGKTLQLSWPADHTGWTLEAQTNSLRSGLSTNWFPVASSTTTNEVVIPIATTNANVLYRLKY